MNGVMKIWVPQIWVISQLDMELFTAHKAHCSTKLISYTKIHASTFYNLQETITQTFFFYAVAQHGP